MKARRRLPPSWSTPWTTGHPCGWATQIADTDAVQAPSVTTFKTAPSVHYW